MSLPLSLPQILTTSSAFVSKHWFKLCITGYTIYLYNTSQLKYTSISVGDDTNKVQCVTNVRRYYDPVLCNTERLVNAGYTIECESINEKNGRYRITITDSKQALTDEEVDERRKTFRDLCESAKLALKYKNSYGEENETTILM